MFIFSPFLERPKTKEKGNFSSERGEGRKRIRKEDEPQEGNIRGQKRTEKIREEK